MLIRSQNLEKYNTDSYFVIKFICTFFFCIPYISDIIWYLSFFLWFASLSMVISKSNHIAANGIL